MTDPAPARLSVGIIAAGRVGTALGEAFDSAGHVVSAVSATSRESVNRARTRLPEARISPPTAVASQSELIVLALPDGALAEVVAEVAPRVNRSAIVLHTCGAQGVAVLTPLADRGCTTIAFHPAMTFTGSEDDTHRLRTACIGLTALDEVGYAVGQALALEVGGEPVRVRESARPLYHAALAHGANHLVAVIIDALAALQIALEGNEFDGQDPVTGRPDSLPSRVLGPLAQAALDNALRIGIDGLTGPAARGDVATVATHLDALTEADPEITAAYRALSLRAATQFASHRGAALPPDLIALLTGHP